MNHTKKLSFSLLALLVGALILVASNRHESFLSDGHPVFFFYPVTLSAIDGNDKLEYDFTHQESTDSITLNFSIESKTVRKVSDLKIKSGAEQISPEYFKVLYTDYGKGKYVTRVQTSFKYLPFRQMFLSSDPIEFIPTIDGESIVFTYKPSKWKKEQEEISKILQIYD